MGKAADLVEQRVHETLTYYAFPDIHWHKIRTNNPLERIMREIRRRTRVVGAFPDGQSCLNLAAARLRHIAGTQTCNSRCRLRGCGLTHRPSSANSTSTCPKSDPGAYIDEPRTSACINEWRDLRALI